MTHDDVSILLKEGYDMPRGWATGKGQPIWHKKVRTMWRSMWRRCYDPTSKDYKKYKDVAIADEFKVFSNYLKWIESQPRFEEFCLTCHKISWNIDKDLKGTRQYFPEYMTLCTKKENIGEMNSRTKRRPVIGIKGNSIILLNSTLEAYDKGFDQGNISRCLKNPKSTHYGYKWRYISYKHNKIYRIKGGN